MGLLVLMGEFQKQQQKISLITGLFQFTKTLKELLKKPEQNIKKVKTNKEETELAS